jgi:hypothetical protein
MNHAYCRLPQRPLNDFVKAELPRDGHSGADERQVASRRCAG